MSIGKSYIMDITQIATHEVLDDQRQVNRRLTRTLDKLGSGSKLTSAKQDPILWGDIQGLKNAVGRMQSYSENLNRGASSIRIASNAMEASDSQLIQLGIELEASLIAPEGSRSRAAALERYNQLHESVNNLAAPKDLGARKLLDDPARFPDAGQFVIAAGENGFEIFIQNRPIHTGAEGLDLPKAGEPLPSDSGGLPVIADINNATSEEIQTMIDFVDLARERLAAKSKALSVDAAAIESSLDFNAAFIQRNDDAVTALNTPDLEAEAVLAQSLNVRNELATFGLTGFEETKRLALSLLQ